MLARHFSPILNFCKALTFSRDLLEVRPDGMASNRRRGGHPSQGVWAIVTRAVRPSHAARRWPWRPLVVLVAVFVSATSAAAQQDYQVDTGGNFNLVWETSLPPCLGTPASVSTESFAGTLLDGEINGTASDGTIAGQLPGTYSPILTIGQDGTILIGNPYRSNPCMAGRTLVTVVMVV